MDKKIPNTVKSESPGKRLLEKAYLLETPDDNIRYYDKLAGSYDRDFADGLGYALPKAVAAAFRKLATSSDSPVVDIGCGTGLLGEALNSAEMVLDGMDISREMLAHTKKKNLYRDLFEVDLTADVSIHNDTYGAVLSSGTFTHGHLGPESLVKLLDLACINALFVIAINQAHYESMGFEQAIHTLEVDGTISTVGNELVRIYQLTGHDHSTDMGIILTFRKARAV